MAASGILTTNLPTFEASDVNKYILTPIYNGEDYMSYMDLMPNIKGVTKIDHFGSAEKGTLGFNEGAFAANADLATMSAVTISPARMEFEQEFRGAQLFNKIKGQLMRGNFEYDNVEGTQVKQILMELIGKGVQSDLNRQLWLGSTAASGGNYTQDNHYKEYDGLFLTAHKKLTTANGSQILDDNDISGFATGDTWVAADSLELLGDLYSAAPAALLEQEGLVFFVSGTVADGYAAHLETQGSYLAFQQLKQGAGLSYRGIPLVVRRDWDRWISTDGSKVNGAHNATAATAKKNTAFAMLTCRNAFAVGTDFSSTSVEQWYSQDNKAYRFRVSYMIGCALTDPNLCVMFTPEPMEV